MTLQSTDVLTGGLGTDTLNVTVGAVGTVQASLSDIETVKANFSAAGTLSLLGSTGVTSVESNNSTAATVFTNIGSTSVGLGVSNTDQDATFTFTAAAVAGTADSATLTLSNQTGGTNVINGIETLNIVSNGGANTIAVLTTDAATTLVVTGGQNLTITADLGATVTNVNASAATGAVNVDFATGAVTATGGSGNDSFEFNAAGAVSATGGAGNDTFDFTATANTFGSTDTVAGGDGTDTLTVDIDDVDTAVITTALTTVTGIETLNITGTQGGTDTVTLADIGSGFNRVNLSSVTGAGTNTFNFAAGANTVGLNVATALTAGTTTVIDAAGSATDDALTITNMLTTGETGSATSTVTITDFETVTIATGTYATPAAQNLGALSAGTGTAITVTGGNGLTLAAGLVATSINASALTGTGALTMSGAATTITSITGSANADTLVGDASSSISGGAGNDTITGGASNDTLLGGDGDDTITFAAGSDSVDAGAGADRVVINSGALTALDTIVGGDGTDTLAYAALLAADDDASLTQAVSGFEVLEITAGASRTLTLSNFLNNTFTRIDVADQAAATLTLNNVGTAVTDLRLITGATGETVVFDRLVDSSTNALTISGRAALNAGGLGVVTAFTANDEETLNISGSSAANDLTISTLTANDLVTLNVTGAADVIISNAIVMSGAALATVNASSATGVVTINATNSTTAITATAGSGVFTFIGGAAADTITGGAAADVLTGGAGADSMTGGEGADYYAGGLGKDKIYLTETTAAADEVELSVGATTYDLITGFSAGGAASNDNLSALQATHGWNSTDGVTTVRLSTGATLAAADTAADSNIITISTNVAVGTFADYAAGTITEADMEALVITGLGITTGLDIAAVVMVLIDDGTSTGVFRFVSGDDGTAANAVVDTEIQIMAILVGVSNAATVVVDDVLFT